MTNTGIALLSANLSRINSVLLVLVAPIVVRLWLEAVVWRLEHGPQMLGFSLMHGAAGWLTVPLILSFVAIYIYALWVAFVVVLWAIPASRKKIANAQFVVLGGASVIVFIAIADFLQQDMATAILLIGAAAMTALVGVMGWVIYAGFRIGQRSRSAAVD